jgi:hypothetical protein
VGVVEAAGRNPGLVGMVAVDVSVASSVNNEVEVEVLVVISVLVSVVKAVDVVENTSVIAVFVVVRTV